MRVEVKGCTVKPWIGYCRGELGKANSSLDNTDVVLLRRWGSVGVLVVRRYRVIKHKLKRCSARVRSRKKKVLALCVAGDLD